MSLITKPVILIMLKQKSRDHQKKIRWVVITGDRLYSINYWWTEVPSDGRLLVLNLILLNLTIRRITKKKKYSSGLKTKLLLFARLRIPGQKSGTMIFTQVAERKI